MRVFSVDFPTSDALNVVHFFFDEQRFLNRYMFSFETYSKSDDTACFAISKARVNFHFVEMLWTADFDPL